MSGASVAAPAIGWSALDLLEKLMTNTRKCGSHEPAMLSDSDIVSNTKSTAASGGSLSDAALTAVSGGWWYYGMPDSESRNDGFPIGRIYKPVMTAGNR